MWKQTTREDDDLDLTFLHHARMGRAPAEIARLTGSPAKFISNRIAAIRTADTAQDPEHAPEWWRQNHPSNSRGRPRHDS